MRGAASFPSRIIVVAGVVRIVYAHGPERFKSVLTTEIEVDLKSVAPQIVDLDAFRGPLLADLRAVESGEIELVDQRIGAGIDLGADRSRGNLPQHLSV